MILTLAVCGYRSLRNLVVGLAPLTVVTGANGAGKSSFYRSLRLLAEVAQGRTIGSLAREGGLESTMWAGPEEISRAIKRGDVPVQGTVRRGPVALKLGFAAEDAGYAVDFGYSSAGAGLFALDPVIKAEAVWRGDVLTRRNVLAVRRGAAMTVTSLKGEPRSYRHDLAPHDSMLHFAASDDATSELVALRERLRAWRFYDDFRTDRDAPARRAQVGTRTPVLASDGSDLAAAVQTIREDGDGDAFDTTIEEAFPGSRIEVTASDGLFEVTMRQPGMLRPLRGAELSEGTLRYILLAAALLTPRPPTLMVVNEPETGLHQDLIEPLAGLIAAASDACQIVVVSHSDRLVRLLAREQNSVRIELTKELGETIAPEHPAPKWAWPER